MPFKFDSSLRAQTVWSAGEVGASPIRHKVNMSTKQLLKRHKPTFSII